MRVPWTARSSNQSILKDIREGAEAGWWLFILNGECWDWVDVVGGGNVHKFSSDCFYFLHEVGCQRMRKGGGIGVLGEGEEDRKHGRTESGWWENEP